MQRVTNAGKHATDNKRREMCNEWKARENMKRRSGS